MSEDEKSDKVKEPELRKALRDIIQSSSKVIIEPKSSSVLYSPSKKFIEGYAKHFNLNDQLHLDESYDNYLQKAVDTGLPTKEEAIQRMYDEGLWTEEEEKWVKSQRIFVDNLKQTKAKLAIKSQADQVQKNIDSIQSKLIKKENKRRQLIGSTCEQYADLQLNSYTMLYCLYRDKECTEKLFDQEDEEYLDHTDIATIISSYNNGMKLLSLETIKYLSISSFFISYFNLIEENPASFFERPVYDLTFYQLNLLSYAKVLRSIIKNTSPPKHLHGDPDKLFEWAEKGESARKLMEKAQNSDNFSVVGAKGDDYKEMGVARKGKSIFDQAVEKNAKSKKPSGELGIMDFISD